MYLSVSPTGDAETDITWQMKGGFPQSWDCAWDNLAWRHHRPHRSLPRERTTAQEGEPQEATSLGSGSTPSHTHREVPISLVNGVTGRNNTKKAKKRDKDELDRHTSVSNLPSHLDKVTTGLLVFICVEVSSAEGELAVGLARAMQTCDTGECKFMWFVRKEWCKNPRKHEWSKTPTFRVAADPDHPSKPYVTKEPLSKVLPLDVVLTQKSKQNYPRLDSECVRKLKELCVQRGLVQAMPFLVAQPSVATAFNEDSSDASYQEPEQEVSMTEPYGSGLIAERLLARKRARMGK